MIPSIFHQTWRSCALPAPFDRLRATWQRHHPGWDLRLYDDDACRRLVADCGRPWISIYERLDRPVLRADLFRYLAVHRYGGLYADIDMECLKPVDPLLAGRQCVLGIEAHLSAQRQRELGYARPFQIANCIFAATPGHPFLSALLAAVAQRAAHGVQNDAQVEEATGPRLLTRVVEGLDATARAQLTVLPQICWLAPLDYPNRFPLNIRMYARHLCAGTWKQDRGQLTLKRRWIERNRLPWPWPVLERGGGNTTR